MTEDIDVSTGHRAFFKRVFGRYTVGYVCISVMPPDFSHNKEKLFAWPEELEGMLEYVDRHKFSDNVYYCTQPLVDPLFKRADGKGPRVKENVKYCTAVWADLDRCHPDTVLVSPTLAMESSPGRYQALWVMEEPIDAEEGEQISQRIAYFHAADGADRSGWPLTKLLRVPLTRNHKYGEGVYVRVIGSNRRLYRIKDFDVYPKALKREGTGIPMPDQGDLPTEPPLELLERYKHKLHLGAFKLFKEKPEEGEFKEKWSGALWKLLMYLFEGGMSREEVFSIAKAAACNKYERDGRPDEHLWNDTCRAYVKHQANIKAVIIPEYAHVDLATPEELDRVARRYTFVERYITWATNLGDAAPQYHEGAAFVVLSALLSGSVLLPTSFGNIYTNIWVMVLGDTTITRKSTAMDIGIDLLLEVDPDVVMATDGSIEGLLQGLSTRPGKPSIFLRDELAGLLESMSKKDYMAGMAEMLTKLYDGKTQKRLLRAGPIDIRDPRLIFFAGGIRSRIQSLLSLDHVSSGFMPRFVFLTADADVTRIKPLGPPVARDSKAREALIAEIQDIYNHYNQLTEMNIAGAGIKPQVPKKWRATLTPRAWGRFNKFESDLLDAAVKSDRPEILTPLYDRLGKSTLKVAVLVAASEQRTDEVTVDEIDILHAISFCADWRRHAIDVVNKVGQTNVERDIERVLTVVRRNRTGISRSKLMQYFHLTAHSADAIFRTLEQRAAIRKVSTANGGTVYFPAEEPDA